MLVPSVSTEQPGWLPQQASNSIDSCEDKVSQNNSIDLEIALKKIHELAMADGDLGYAYWYQVGQLLKRAAGMQAEIDALSKELERCRAQLGS